MSTKVNLQFSLDVDFEILHTYIGDEGEERYLVRALIKPFEKDGSEFKNKDLNWLILMTLFNSEFVCSSGDGKVEFTRGERLFSIKKEEFKYFNRANYAGILKEPE